jgi:uncharacterized protein (AIM24 family)
MEGEAMGLQLPWELATDGRFREAAGWGDPPRAGVVTAVEASGQVRVAMDGPDGGDVLAWPLNGFTYAVDAVVYVAFAANSPDGGVVLRAKAPLPALHVHNGTGGLVFLTKTGIDGTVRMIVANGTDDVTAYFLGHAVVSDGSTGGGGQVAAAVGGNVDIAVGTLTVCFSVAAAGSFTVRRQSGTGTATVALLGVWM